jgi:hypothetical protein
VARQYEWSRASSGQTITDGSRFGLLLGEYPADSTFERVIFGYNIRQTAFFGGATAGPTSTHLRMGVVGNPLAAGPPNIDPGAPTTADWLWAGLVHAEVLQLRHASDREFQVRFTSPAAQLESVTRRHNDSGATIGVYLVTGPMADRGSEFPTWTATVYGSVLYSYLP